jgi:hypothetical protein
MFSFLAVSKYFSIAKKLKNPFYMCPQPPLNALDVLFKLSTGNSGILIPKKWVGSI